MKRIIYTCFILFSGFNLNAQTFQSVTNSDNHTSNMIRLSGFNLPVSRSSSALEIGYHFGEGILQAYDPGDFKYKVIGIYGGQDANYSKLSVGYDSLSYNGSTMLGLDANSKLKLKGNVYLTSGSGFVLFGTNPSIHPYKQSDINNNLSLGNNNLSKLILTSSGAVGIGTTTPDSKLAVAGKIHAEEVKVSWVVGADFVFEEEYKLPNLFDTEKFIKANRHLLEIPSAKQIEKDGLKLGEMNVKLLQKIEELTLYLIELNKTVQHQQSKLTILRQNFRNLMFYSDNRII